MFFIIICNIIIIGLLCVLCERICIIYMEQIAKNLLAFLDGLGEFWALTIVSFIPFIELRLAIPLGLGLGMPWYEAFLISVISNCVPIPFIILLTRPIFDWLKKRKLFEKFVTKFEARMMKKSEKVTKYEMIGLFLFVAIPLPGTGAYSGSVIAALLGMRLKKAIPSIAAGVFVAGVIVTIITYGAAAIVSIF